MTKIIPVEYPKPKPPTPPTYRGVFEDYPLPWKLGEEHEFKCEIVAANGASYTISSMMRGVCEDNSLGVGPHDLAELFAEMVNLQHKAGERKPRPIPRSPFPGVLPHDRYFKVDTPEPK